MLPFLRPQACLCIICTIILLMPIIGGIWFGVEQTNLKYYTKSDCLITNSSVITTTCNFIGGKQKGRLTDPNTCYRPWWVVLYNTTNSTQICSSIIISSGTSQYSEAMKQMKMHAINTTSTCFYDIRDITKAQWNSPNPVPGIIIMSIGLAIWFVLGICACFIWSPWREESTSK